ncbi:hypothetical protein PD335_004835 [Salmonella enterica]|nr:hypothetical protein [Salmonella enterica subsp. enterica serovar Lattenkamp]EEM6937050.1 hypothetical protein [Salmonella enterica]EEC3243655.1 hypothetical protein [Salmonella enterica subsp. enterica serovar Lattenkamp]EEP2430406.1 hypothetical protein [Salmonella enterica]EEP5145202.1 hypothetical protein [Salmonella enterica]
MDDLISSPVNNADTFCKKYPLLAVKLKAALPDITFASACNEVTGTVSGREKRRAGCAKIFIPLATTANHWWQLFMVLPASIRFYCYIVLPDR